MTPEEIGLLADTPGYWWRDSNGDCYATAEFDEQSPDTYLMYASPAWCAQWGGDWEAAAAALAEIAAQT
jgi:hypothetical protein